MALIKCKECGSEVSSKADACPKCGVKIKKSMGCGSLIAVVFLSFIVIGLISSSLSTDSGPASSSSTSSSSAPREKSPRELKEEIRAQINLDWAWRKAGFDNIMHADFTITNASSYDIKDVEIRTLQFAKSGTQIDRNVRTIYEIIKAGETREFKEFNMGFIHSQSNSASASITDFVLIR